MYLRSSLFFTSYYLIRFILPCNYFATSFCALVVSFLYIYLWLLKRRSLQIEYKEIPPIVFDRYTIRENDNCIRIASRCGVSRLAGCAPRTRRFSRFTPESWHIMHVSRSPTKAGQAPDPSVHPVLREWPEVARPRRKSLMARGVCTFASWRRPTGIVTCARSTLARWYPSLVVLTYTVSVISYLLPRHIRVTTRMSRARKSCV